MFSSPRMSDFFNTLLIMAVVGFLFLAPAALLGGIIAVEVVAALLIAISCFLYLYMLALGKSFSNSNSSSNWDSKIIISFAGIVFFYTYIAYGAYCLSEFIHGAQEYFINLSIWLFCLVVIPVYSFLSRAYRSHRIKTKHYKNNIVLIHPTSFPVLIDQIRFFNSKTNTSSHTYSEFFEDPSQITKYEGVTKEKETDEHQKYYTELGAHFLPISFDSFELSWYSVLENRFYKDTFPLDQEKLDINQSHNGQMSINDLSINILPNGNVDLLKSFRSELIHSVAYNKVDFSVVEQNNFESIVAFFSAKGTSDSKKDKMKAYLTKHQQEAELTISQLELLNFRSIHTYSFEIQIIQKQWDHFKLDQINTIDFYLNKYCRNAEFLNAKSKKPLPSFIQIEMLNSKDKRRCVNIIFDKQALFNQFTSFVDSTATDTVFEIVVDVKYLNKSEICLNSANHRMVLNGYRVLKS